MHGAELNILEESQTRRQRRFAPPPVTVPASFSVRIPTSVSTKRHRNGAELDISEEPQTKRQRRFAPPLTTISASVSNRSSKEPQTKHQRRFAPSHAKRTSHHLSKPNIFTQSRYSLRPTRERIRRGTVESPPARLPSITATPTPIPTPAPVLAKPLRDGGDDDIPNELQAKRHRRIESLIPAPVPAPSKTPIPALLPASDSAPVTVSTPTPATASTRIHIQVQPITLPVLNSTNISLHASPPIVACASTPIPSRSPAPEVGRISMAGPPYPHWEELPEATRTRLSAYHYDLISRVWGDQSAVTGYCWTDYAKALGLSTDKTHDGAPTDGLADTYPDVLRSLYPVWESLNFYEFSHHGKSC